MKSKDPSDDSPTEAPDTRHGRARAMLSPRHAGTRLLFASLAAAGGIVAVAPVAPVGQAWWVSVVAGWDAGALMFIALAWFVILRTDSASTKQRAGGDDPGRHTVFALALAASLFSLFASVFILKEVRSLSGAERTVWTLLALAAIAFSWLLTHTAYTLRYAHIYYRGGASERGLTFPGDRPPADIDFAYFAFTIGMCFQVSDVVICSKAFRRTVLLHALLSFVYNTTILALSLNVVFTTMT
jgi:uncharacterized membrane protein